MKVFKKSLLAITLLLQIASNKVENILQIDISFICKFLLYGIGNGFINSEQYISSANGRKNIQITYDYVWDGIYKNINYTSINLNNLVDEVNIWHIHDTLNNQIKKCLEKPVKNKNIDVIDIFNETKIEQLKNNFNDFLKRINGAEIEYDAQEKSNLIEKYIKISDFYLDNLKLKILCIINEKYMEENFSLNIKKLKTNIEFMEISEYSCPNIFRISARFGSSIAYDLANSSEEKLKFLKKYIKDLECKLLMGKLDGVNNFINTLCNDPKKNHKYILNFELYITNLKEIIIYRRGESKTKPENELCQSMNKIIKKFDKTLKGKTIFDLDDNVFENFFKFHLCKKRSNFNSEPKNKESNIVSFGLFLICKNIKFLEKIENLSLDQKNADKK